MFTERLHALRGESGWTQVVASEKIGISWRTYQDLEAGKKPSFDTLLKIADTFHVSVDYLMGRTDDREVHQL